MTSQAADRVTPSGRTQTAECHRGRYSRRRKVLTSLAALGVLLSGYVGWSNWRAFVLTAEIDIDATPDQVWGVLSDLDSYPQWNPFIVSAVGELTKGATLTNTMVDAEGSQLTFTPTVLAADPGQELRWIGKVAPGLLFDGEHSFVLTPLPGGGTRLLHSERFTGALVPPMQGWLTGSTLPQFHAMNTALAQRVADVY
jgi:hypothetical protein